MLRLPNQDKFQLRNDPAEKNNSGVFKKPLSIIYDRAFYENSSQLKAINYFRKNAPSQMFDRVLNTLLNSNKN